ncbi:hypothetical protein [Burkholderia sp. MBR-1]|nr:hypothetical protein [Burkholderia sp. MBR-1]QMI49914.1 hypothetical protein MBR110_31130 [Burkholderia sp. MBR-1]
MDKKQLAYHRYVEARAGLRLMLGNERAHEREYWLAFYAARVIGYCAA